MPTISAEPHFFVIQLSRSLNASNAIEFHRQVTAAVRKERHNMVLVNLEQVEFLDSAGLMALVDGLRLAKILGQRLSLCSVSPSIRIIFEITQLDQVFEIVENVAAFEAALV